MRLQSRQGFTLIELMTSMAITAIVLVGVAASFAAVQRVYQREAQIKSVVEGGRVSTAHLERVVRLAGYGLDPGVAIDISTASLVGVGGTKSNFPVPITSGNAVTDDFAFRYRDPSYLRRGTFNGTQVTLDNTAGPGTFGIDLRLGRLLQVACPGAMESVIVKTTAAVTGAATQVAVGSAAGLPAPTTPTPTCLRGTGTRAPYVMLVREMRLRVIPLGPTGQERPYLVAYNTLDLAGTGTTTVTDFDPIAADVESFQVSYVMNRGGTGIASDGASGNQNWVLGDDSGDNVRIPTAVGTRPTYRDGYLDQVRFSADIANVRAVTFDIALRSTRNDARRSTVRRQMADDVITPATADGFHHLQVSTTVRLPNMTSRTFFVPALRVVGDPSPLNEWGG